MPKGFAQMNYYEMLDVKPDATMFEIRHAYNTALQLYQPGSLASYSLFSGDERKEILALVEQAYATLINDQNRKNYDQALVARGEMEAGKDVSSVDKKPVSVFDISRGPAVRTSQNNREALKDRISQSATIADILARGEISGADLKTIRTELGVMIEHIAQETKIRHDHLRSMEEDQLARLPAAVFLKGFVKAYLNCLCLDPVDELSTRYMNSVARRLRK
ncbi:MAG: helix-turn-helix domain-containing protein [Deltaproteobacteria bacterium]